VPVKQPAPHYPPALKQAGSQGQAVIEFTVGPDGTVTDAHPVHSTDPAFADAATAAVQQWQFKPGQLAGQPVGTRLQVPIVFQIVNDSGNWF
jgi:TonB family protein